MNIMISLKNTKAASLVIYILRSLRSHTFVQYDEYNYHSPTWWASCCWRERGITWRGRRILCMDGMTITFLLFICVPTFSTGGGW